MTREEVESIVNRKPFVPLVMQMTDGREFDVPFGHVIVSRGPESFLLFKGVKAEGSRQATGYEHLSYEHVKRLERKRPPARRRKAS